MVQGTVELRAPGGKVITSETYASMAEGVMRQYMAHYKTLRPYERLTTTKLRSIYSLIMNLYVRATSPEEYERHKGGIQYLKVRMAYEAGRERSVKEFLDKTGLMKFLDSITSFDQFMLYCRYAEALVAYFKFFDGKDS